MKPNSELDGRSVLIVEDKMMVAIMLEQTFIDAGASDVTFACSIEDAWDAVSRKSFDFALLDIRLPDGYSFPLAIDLFAKGMPVTMHSAHAGIYHSARLPGIVFCPKPATPTELIQAAHKAIYISANPTTVHVQETLH
ncbi:MAG: response regulator [Pseudomonadota bacterium]